LTQAAWQSEDLLSDFGSVVVENVYITEAPTITPSRAPTTSLPTAAPSLSGSVAIVELSRPVTESIPESEVTSIQSEVAETYGVDAEDVTVEVVYQTTGTLDIAVTDDTASQEEVEEDIEKEVAALLGVHEGNVEVTIEDGVASYTITSDSAEAAKDIQDALLENETTETIDNAVSGVDVSGVNVNADVTAEVVVTVDTSSADNNLDNAAQSLEDSFENQGYNAETESNFCTRHEK
jgi:hypothetical protein